MRLPKTTRPAATFPAFAGLCCVVALCVFSLGSMSAATGWAQAPIVRPQQNAGNQPMRENHQPVRQAQPFNDSRQPANRTQTQGPGGRNQALGGGGRPVQHLQQWLNSRQGQPLAEQQRELEQEPGFHQLNPQVQQRMHERLSQLNSMPPEQRQRVLARTEAMERLQPAQRQQVRDAYAQLGSLPIERRRMVARTFNYTRSLPPNQRQGFLNSPQLRGQLSDSERGTLNNLLNAPYIPPAATGPQAAPESYPR